MKKLSFVLLALALFSSSAHAAGREWSVDPTSALRLILDEKYESSRSASTNQTGQTLSFEFGRNWGSVEAGPMFVSTNYKSGDDTQSVLTYGAYVRYNFLPNEVGTMLVPFVRASYVMGSTKSQFPPSAETQVDLNQFRLRGGATWFPVNDFVAVEGYLEYSDRKYKPATYDYKYSGIVANAVFAVYF